jgi:hypothetical protein
MTERFNRYLVCATNAGDGENMDLFVNAISTDAAIEYFCAYYEMELNEFYDVRVITIPDSSSLGAIDWDRVVQVKVKT